MSDKENKKRADLIKIRVSLILDSLIDNSEMGKLDPLILSYFGYLTRDFEFPPNNVYFKFEVSRMKFNKFGALKEMNAKFS